MRQNIRRRRDDGGEHKDEHDRVGPRPRHECVSEQAETNERQDHHRQFESKSETDA